MGFDSGGGGSGTPNVPDWTEDDNSPATATGANSITYTLATAWDFLEVYVVAVDQASSGNNASLTVDGNTAAGDYSGNNYNSNATGGTELSNVLTFGADATQRGVITIVGNATEVGVATQYPSASANHAAGRLVTESHDGTVDQFTLDRGAATDWKVEVYGRDLGAP